MDQITSGLDLALSWVAPLTVLAGIGLAAYQAFLYVMGLSVTGKANEWVLIINNGKLRQAGIGLSTMRMPGDTVARIPSKVNKVEFKAQQVTSEMSGVEVSAMICWTINREGEGPLKAYTNLGSDIASGNPAVANNLITSMASAVMRNRIANITVDDVLKKRQMLRTAVRTEISKVVTGWGVWLETVEITDVKIMSGELFKNLQCKFREDQSKQAQLLQMEVNNEIRLQTSTYNVKDAKRVKDIEVLQLQARQEVEYEQKKDAVNIFTQTKAIEKEDLKDRNEVNLYQSGQIARMQKLDSKYDLEYLQVDVSKQIERKAEAMKTAKQEQEFANADTQKEIDSEDLKAQQANDQMVRQFVFKKEQLADKAFMARKRTEVIQTVYKQQTNRLRNYQVFVTADKDPMSMVLDNFIADAVPGQKK